MDTLLTLPTFMRITHFSLFINCVQISLNDIFNVFYYNISNCQFRCIKDKRVSSLDCIKSLLHNSCAAKCNVNIRKRFIKALESNDEVLKKY